MKYKVKFLIYLLVIFFSINIWAVPPAPWLKDIKGPSHDNNPLNISSIKHSPTSGVYTTTAPNNPKVLVIRVNFTDQQVDLSQTEVTNFFSQARTYYLNQSNNQCDMTVTVSSSVYMLDHDYAYYGTDGVNDYDGEGGYNCLNLVHDAIDLADPDYNLTSFDSIIIFHSGVGQESSGVSTDIWSVRWSGLNYSTNDGIINSAIVVPEQEDAGASILGTVVHEMGHDLGDLPDLYDISNPASHDGIGRWGLMASGSWNNNGNNPSDFCGWTKIKLGWVTPIEPSVNIDNVSINSSNSSKTIYKIANSSDSNEYFLIENRQEDYIPGKGLLVLHINENQTTNQNVSNKLVDIEEQDNDGELDTYIGYGDPQGESTDVFISGNIFSDTTTPNSKWYNNTSSNLNLHNISSSSANMTANIYVGVSGAPVISSVETQNNSGTTQTQFNKGDDVKIIVNEESSNGDATVILTVTGSDFGYNSGDINTTQTQTGVFEGTFPTTARNAGTYNINAVLTNSFGSDTDTNTSFTIVDPTPDVVSLSLPEDGAEIGIYNVEFSWSALSEIPDNYIFEISENIDFNTLTHTNTLAGNLENPSYTISESLLSNNTEYFWRVYGVKDSYSNIDGAEKRSFTISIDEVSPELTTSNPEDASTNLPLDTVFTLTFNEALDSNTVTTANIQLTTGGNSVNCTLDYNSENYIVTLTPESNLIYGTDYQISINTSVTDLAANNITSTIILNFSTEDYKAPEEFIVIDTPGDGGGSYTANWDLSNQPYDVTTDIKEYRFYYIQKDTIFTEEDLDSSQMIVWNSDEITYPASKIIEIANSIDNNYTFAIRYITNDDKLSKFSFSEPRKSIADAEIASQINFEINPERTVSGYQTEYTISLKPNMTNESDTGFDKILVNVADFSSIDFSESTFFIGETEYTYNTNPGDSEFSISLISSDTIEVKTGNILTKDIILDNNLNFSYKATLEDVAGTQKTIDIKVINTLYNIELETEKIQPDNADDDLGNSDSNIVTISTTITNAVGEISPDRFSIGSTSEVNLFVNVEADDTSVGFDEMQLELPQEYYAIDTQEWELKIDGQILDSENYNITVTGFDVSVLFSNMYFGNRNIECKLNIIPPFSPDIQAGGEDLIVKINNSTYSMPELVTAGDADGQENTNTLTLKTGKVCEQGTGEIYPYIVAAGSTSEYSLYLKPYITSSNFGFDNIKLVFDENFKNFQLGSIEVETEGIYNLTTASPEGNEFSYITSVDENEYWTININFGKIFDSTYSNKLYTIHFSMEASTENVSQSLINASLSNSEVGGNITVISGNANIDITSERLDISIKNPAESCIAEIVPSNLLLNNNVNAQIFINTVIDSQVNSGVDLINLYLPENFDSTLDTTEIKIYSNVTNSTDGNELTHSFSETPLSGTCYIEYDDSKKGYYIRLGDISYSDSTWRIELPLITPDELIDDQYITAYVDNFVAKSPLIATAGDADNNSENNNTLDLKVGRLLYDSPFNIYTQSVTGDVNSVAFGSTDQDIQFNARAILDTDVTYGFNKLLISIPEGFTNLDLTNAKLIIGEVEFTTSTVNTQPDEEEIYITYDEEVTSGGTVEITFGRLIEDSWPLNDKIIKLNISMDVPSLEGEYLFNLYAINTLISSDMNQMFYAGNSDYGSSTDVNSINIIKTPAQSAITEIFPYNVKPSQNITLNVFNKFTFTDQNSGIKTLRISMPTGYTDIKTSNLDGTHIFVDGIEYSITTNSNPIGNVVYLNSAINYIDIKFGKILKKDTTTEKNVRVQLACKTSAESTYPYGDTVEVQCFKEDTDSLYMYADGGDATTLYSGNNNVNYVFNSISSIYSESVHISENFKNNSDNLMMFNSIDNEINAYIQFNFVTGNRGINLLGIDIPAEFCQNGNPIDSSSMKLYGPDSSEINIVYQNFFADTNVYYLGLSDTIENSGTYKLIYNINSPDDDSTVDESFEFRYFGDYHLESFSTQDDGYDFRVTASSSNITEYCPTNSNIFTIIKTPARFAYGEIYPSSTVINKTETFTLTLNADIQEDNSGINSVKLDFPTTLSDISIIGLIANNKPYSENTSSSDIFVKNQTGNSVILTLVDDYVTNLSPNQKFIVSFTGKTQNTSYYGDNNLVKAELKDTNSGRSITVSSGDAQASSSTDTLNITISALVSSALAKISPNFMVQGSQNNIFTINTDLTFDSGDIGVKILNIKVPDTYTELNIDNSTISVNNTDFSIIQAGFPGTSQVLQEYDENSNEIKLTFGQTFSEDTNIIYTFTLTAPEQPYTENFEIEIVNNTYGIIQSCNEKFSGSLLVSTEQANIDTPYTNLVSNENGTWRLNMEIPFNVKMNIDYPGVKVYFNGIKATILSYDNQAYPSYSDNIVGLIRCYADIDFDNVGLITGDKLVITGTKDLRGNLVNITRYIEPSYGIAISVFVNPVDSKSFAIVARSSVPLENNHTMIFEVKEHSTTSGYIMPELSSSGIYSGIYKIENDASPVINASIFENYGTSNQSRIKMVFKEFTIIKLAPELDKSFSVEDLQFNISKKSVTKDSNMIIVSSKQDSVVGLEINKAFNLIYNNDFKKPIELTVNNLPKKSLLFRKDKDKLIYTDTPDNNTFKINRGGNYVIAADNNQPQMVKWNTNGNSINYSIQDKESKIDKVYASIDGEEYYNIPENGYLKLPGGTHNICIKATDKAGNTLIKNTTMKIAPSTYINNISVYPNPCENYANIKFNTIAASKVLLKIYDVSGRLVYRQNTIGTGADQILMWDLIDKNGKYVANGVYYYVLKISDSTGSDESKGKIVVIR